MSGFEAVIGLEVHVQLATESKIFCSCRARLKPGESVADVPPNANTCPICAGHPGTLPVLNRKVVEYAVLAGLATGCSINRDSIFARKNYFYPDLPKGYQLSQYERPICENGFLSVATVSGAKRISIRRIHMEEDAGKSVHRSDSSLVNLNRAGVPLVEIVSAPDLRSSAEAGAYLRALYAIVTSLGICDGNLQEGNFRCDANVSVRPEGASELGTRAEIKNVNSFRFVEKAIDFEISRQIAVINSGGMVVQETRLYDSDRNVTSSMRSKEEAHDYRYFPDPDLLPVSLSQESIDVLRSKLPELPEAKKARYESELGLSSYDAGVLTSSAALSGLFEKTLEILLAPGTSRHQSFAKSISNFVTGEVARLMNDEGKDPSASHLRAEHLADLIRMVEKGEISASAAKQVITMAWKAGGSAAEIVAREGLKQVSDEGALGRVIDEVLGANASQVSEYRAGKEKVMGFFVGQIMKKTGGKANLALLQELIKKKLS